MPPIPLRDVTWSSKAYDFDVTGGTIAALRVDDDTNHVTLQSQSVVGTLAGVVPTLGGRPIWITYTGTQRLRIANESGLAADPKYRLRCPDGLEVVLESGNSAMLVRNHADQRWDVHAARAIGWNTGTSFPSSAVDGQRFYRTDLHEWFTLDDAAGLWVGEHAKTYNFGLVGTVGVGIVHLNGAGGAMFGGTTNGYHIGFDARVTAFGLAWAVESSIEAAVRRNNIEVATAAITSATSHFEGPIFEPFAANGQLQLTVGSIGGGQQNISAWVELVKVIEA